MMVSIEVDGVAYEAVVDRKAGTVTVDGQAFAVKMERNAAGLLVRVGDKALHVQAGEEGATIEGSKVSWRLLSLSRQDEGAGGPGSGGARVKPPMNGKLERLLVKPGQAVKAGDVLFILEAMKMQNEVRSPVTGKVAAVHKEAGATVDPSQVVVEIAAA